MKKTQQDWQYTFKQQKESGLTIKDFCSKNKITLSTFYKYKQLNTQSSEFIQAKVVHHTTEQIIEPPKSAKTVIILDTTVGQLTLPGSISPQFLIHLMRGLS
mgnify:FL=1